MYQLANLFLHDSAESKDIVHDVFAQLMSWPEKDLQEDKIVAYLHTCVRNKCLNVMRNRKIQERIKRQYLFDLDATHVPNDVLYEELKVLSLGIERLVPPVCREVIELHFCDGLTFREIALRLKVSETTVYKYLRKALEQLRTHLNNNM